MAGDHWTHAQFEQMSWHDNHVHALRFVQGEYGSGDLILDIDYIVEWVREPAEMKFRILPATLRFTGVTNLRVTLDYASATAAMGPFSIHTIGRRTEARERYEAQLWTIMLNWPVGELSFEAGGYEQTGWGKLVLASRQHLLPEERSDA
jgi:hypothetical protein